MTKQNKPVFGTHEWASSNHNILDGCQHNCKYCYARAKAATPAWYIPKLKPGIMNKGFGKRSGTIMFPTTHDILPEFSAECTLALVRMLEKGNKVLVVSKPHLKCIKAICEICQPFKQQILFRFTIGSANNKVLSFWEPGAPSFEERLNCLKHAFEQGFLTSVSCEPMLDNRIDLVVEAALPYVNDAIWLGKANFLVDRLKANSEWDAESEQKAQQLIEWQNDEEIHKLYEKYKSNPLIKWKESIKKVVGLEIPTTPGLDI